MNSTTEHALHSSQCPDDEHKSLQRSRITTSHVEAMEKNNTKAKDDSELTRFFFNISIGNEEGRKSSDVVNTNSIDCLNNGTTQYDQAQAYLRSLEHSRGIRRQLLEEKLNYCQDHVYNNGLNLSDGVVAVQVECDDIDSNSDDDDEDDVDFPAQDDRQNHSFHPERTQSADITHAREEHGTVANSRLSTTGVNFRQNHNDEIKIDDLREMDVILHRGIFSSKRSGNIVYHELILSMKDEYDFASKKEKTNISWKIYHKIMSKGGRFLFKKRTGVYFEPKVSSKVRRKIAQCFRDAKRLKNNSQPVVTRCDDNIFDSDTKCDDNDFDCDTRCDDNDFDSDTICDVVTTGCDDVEVNSNTRCDVVTTGFDDIDVGSDSDDEDDQDKRQTYSLNPVTTHKAHSMEDHCKVVRNLLSTTGLNFHKKQNDEIKIDDLREMDVILHRGTFSSKRSGNIVYHELILSMKDEYDFASKKEKPNISWKIYDKIMSKGGRFLFKKREGVYFEPKATSKVRQKIAQCFRDAKRLKNNSQPVVTRCDDNNDDDVNFPKFNTGRTQTAERTHALTKRGTVANGRLSYSPWQSDRQTYTSNPERTHALTKQHGTVANGRLSYSPWQSDRQTYTSNSERTHALTKQHGTVANSRLSYSPWQSDRQTYTSNPERTHALTKQHGTVANSRLSYSPWQSDRQTYTSNSERTHALTKRGTVANSRLSYSPGQSDRQTYTSNTGRTHALTKQHCTVANGRLSYSPGQSDRQTHTSNKERTQSAETTHALTKRGTVANSRLSYSPGQSDRQTYTSNPERTHALTKHCTVANSRLSYSPEQSDRQTHTSNRERTQTADITQAREEHGTVANSRLSTTGVNFHKKQNDEIKIDDLREMDVILHRGIFSSKRSGNIVYHELILSMKDEYDFASKKEKTNISWKIYDKIMSKGGRFLFKKREGVYFEPKATSKVRRKIAQCFRDAKRLKKSCNA